MKKITEKYKNLQNDPSDLDGATHFSKLNHNINNTNNNKSILIVPGVWPGLDYEDALSLGQNLLKESKFSVILAVQAHPLSTLENALELNPHVCGPKTNEFF